MHPRRRGTFAVTVADTEGGPARGMPPQEAHVPTLPLQKSVESKARKMRF